MKRLLFITSFMMLFIGCNDNKIDTVNTFSEKTELEYLTESVRKSNLIRINFLIHYIRNYKNLKTTSIIKDGEEIFVIYGYLNDILDSPSITEDDLINAKFMLIALKEFSHKYDVRFDILENFDFKELVSDRKKNHIQITSFKKALSLQTIFLITEINFKTAGDIASTPSYLLPSDSAKVVEE